MVGQLNRAAPPLFSAVVPLLGGGVLGSTVLGKAKNGPIFRVVATLCAGAVGMLSFVVLIETLFSLS